MHLQKTLAGILGLVLALGCKPVPSDRGEYIPAVRRTLAPFYPQSNIRVACDDVGYCLAFVSQIASPISLDCNRVGNGVECEVHVFNSHFISVEHAQ